jgi:hypothetical protein
MENENEFVGVPAQLVDSLSVALPAQDCDPPQLQLHV